MFLFGAVIANSQRAPYTLKAESAEEAREWAQAIEMHAPRILQMRGAVKESAGEEGAPSTETMMPRGGPLQGIEEGDEEQSVDGSVLTETGRESSLGAGGAESSEVLLPLSPAPAPEPMARQQPMEIPDEEDEWSGLMPHRGEPEPEPEPERVRQPAVSQPEEASRVVEPEPETGANLDLDLMRVSTAVPAGERP